MRSLIGAIFELHSNTVQAPLPTKATASSQRHPGGWLLCLHRSACALVSTRPGQSLRPPAGRRSNCFQMETTATTLTAETLATPMGHTHADQHRLCLQTDSAATAATVGSQDWPSPPVQSNGTTTQDAAGGGRRARKTLSIWEVHEVVMRGSFAPSQCRRPRQVVRQPTFLLVRACDQVRRMEFEPHTAHSLLRAAALGKESSVLLCIPTLRR